MKNLKLNKIVLCCMLFVSPFLAMANDIDDQDGDVQDVPAAPINDYIPMALMVAVGLSYVLLTKKKTVKN